MYSRRFSIITLITIIALMTILSSSIFAKGTNENEVGFKIVNVAHVPVTLYDDGRIKGIENPSELSKEQRKEILKLMRFTEEEIGGLPEDLQIELLKDGGVKVDSVMENMLHVYTDLDGVDHIVTEENTQEIEQIKARDYKRATKGRVKISSTTLNSYSDGKFTGEGIIVYLGTTADGLEYIYDYKTKFTWSSRPALYYVDTIGQAWQDHTVSVSTSDEYYVKLYSSSGNYLGSIMIGLHDIDYSSVYGTKAKADIDYHDGEHIGWLSDEVRIPVREKGLTGQFASAYGHAWSGVDITATIKMVSVELDGYGDKWSWRNSFEIGQSY
jgi:hypothetical protein